jgi:hypothetical protein
MLVSISVSVLVVAVIFIFATCDNGDAGSYFTYDGNTYELATAVIERGGENTEPGESGYFISFAAASAGMDIINLTGTGDGIGLDLNSSSYDLVAGTYTWSTTNVENTVVDAMIVINYNLATDEGTAYLAIDATVTVSVSGDTYTVEFTLTLENAKTVTGIWEGSATVVDV